MNKNPLVHLTAYAPPAGGAMNCTSIACTFPCCGLHTFNILNKIKHFTSIVLLFNWPLDEKLYLMILYSGGWLTMQASQSINFILWCTNEICSSHWPYTSEAVSGSLIQLSPEVLRTKWCDHFCARKKKQRENRGGRVSSELHMASVVLFGVKCEQHKSNLRVGNKRTLTNGVFVLFCFFTFSILVLNHQCWTKKESWGGKLKRNSAPCAQ